MAWPCLSNTVSSNQPPLLLVELTKTWSDLLMILRVSLSNTAFLLSPSKPPAILFLSHGLFPQVSTILSVSQWR